MTALLTPLKAVLIVVEAVLWVVVLGVVVLGIVVLGIVVLGAVVLGVVVLSIIVLDVVGIGTTTTAVFEVPIVVEGLVVTIDELEREVEVEEVVEIGVETRGTDDEDSVEMGEAGTASLETVTGKLEFPARLSTAFEFRTESS